MELVEELRYQCQRSARDSLTKLSILSDPKRTQRDLDEEVESFDLDEDKLAKTTPITRPSEDGMG